MDTHASTPPIWTTTPGLTDYETAETAMRRHIAAVREGTAPERVWLLEHPPLYTAGTSARQADLIAPARFPTFATGRGGQWTYHGPGQRIAYVMLDLMRPHGSVPPRDLRAYVHGLEAWLIAALESLGIAAERREGRIGLWVETGAGEAKIAAIGVRVTRWVSWHGIALNVSPDLSHYAGIVPCGISEHGVTSLAALGRQVKFAAVDAALAAAWSGVFGSSQVSKGVLF